MASTLQLSRIDTLKLKDTILRRLGRHKAEKYLYNLSRLLSLKLKRSEYTKLVYAIVGKENLPLHNQFIKSILANAYLSDKLLSKQTTTGHSRNDKMPVENLGNFLPMLPQKGRSVRSRYRRTNERLSPLGPHGKNPSSNIQEFTNPCDFQNGLAILSNDSKDLISNGSKIPLEVISVEDGEEVEQIKNSQGFQSRSPITAPLGLMFDNISSKAQYKVVCQNEVGICQKNNELPDSSDLAKYLEAKLEKQGFIAPEDSVVDMVNRGLDAYLIRLLQPSMCLTKSRPNHTVSLLDFQVAAESDRLLLGHNCPMLSQKICMFSQKNEF